MGGRGLRGFDALRRARENPIERIALRGRLVEPFRRRQFFAFGHGSVVHKPTCVLGAHHISIGERSLVLNGAWLAVETMAWERPGPVLAIGDRVAVRPFCTISASAAITLEDDVIVGAYSSIIDSDHTFADGNPNVMHNRVAADPISIGRGTWIAERVAILRGARIGCCCIIGANSVVKDDIPDFSIAVGAPAKVVGTVEGVDPRAAPAAAGLW
jgi:acetyltransferase-like isoleucine patch superfamily enzyme